MWVIHTFTSSILNDRDTGHLTVVDIAADGTDHRGYTLKAAYDIYAPDVAGMPYLVAVFEMDGKPVVPARVGVREYSYTFHYGAKLRFCFYTHCINVCLHC